MSIYPPIRQACELYTVPVGTKSVSPYPEYDILAKLVLMAHVIHEVQAGGKLTINHIALETDMYTTAMCFFGKASSWVALGFRCLRRQGNDWGNADPSS